MPSKRCRRSRGAVAPKMTTMAVRAGVLPLLSCLLLLVSGCARAAASAAAAAPVPDAPDGRAMIVPEPVFGGKAYIAEWGMGRELSVVLVHGAGDRASRDWDLVVPGLARSYHVVAFDLPGYGRSSKGNHLYSPDRYVAFIHWVVGRYVKGPFVLIGHSLGGALALLYAAGYPDGLRRLILVDAAGILNRISFIKDASLMSGEGTRTRPPSRFDEEVDEFLRFLLDDLSSEEHAARLERALTHPFLRWLLLGGNPKKISALALVLEDYGPAVERVRTPALLIWGQYDRVAPLRTAQALIARMPGTRLEIIAGAGHVPMRDHPAEFDRLVREEIASRPAATAAEGPGPGPLVRTARCDHEQGLLLTGPYKSIELDHCRDVTIRGVTAGRIDVVDSDVVIENSRIDGTGRGLTASRSEITGTAVVIRADTAIFADHSHIDLAGAELEGRKAAVESNDRDVVLFSICHSTSPFYSGPLHGIREVTRDRPL